jgi:peptidoglycan/xylan/chitin deacetylase (PgdA/CDA1 family)
MTVRRVALAYHGIDEVDDASDPKYLIHSAGQLESHVRLLRRLGYGFATAEEVADAGTPDRREALLTFDDGWLNWLTVALPVLERLDVRGTFYVCPGWWGGRHPDVAGDAGRLLEEADARALHLAGMELGSHSMSHPDLRTLDDGELTRELTESKSAVERITGRACRTFAYPYGTFDERVAEAVASAGYDLAFTWQPGPWRRHAAPRLPAPARRGAVPLALKLMGVRKRAA